jgi:hypothetical protein
MKKLIRLFSITFLMLQSCSSDNNENNDVPLIVDEIRPPYTVKYEVLFPINQLNFFGTTHISYSHELNGRYNYITEPGEGRVYFSRNQLIQLNGFWSHTFVATVNTNPLPLQIKTDFNPTSGAIVYFKIYINNVLVENKPINFSPNTTPSIPHWSGIYYNVY